MKILTYLYWCIALVPVLAYRKIKALYYGIYVCPKEGHEITYVGHGVLYHGKYDQVCTKCWRKSKREDTQRVAI